MGIIVQRLKSKTYWLGIATFALGALETAQSSGMLPQMLDGHTRAAITLGTALAIFVLRELTKLPVGEK
jgi:hypothetical protein